MKRKKKTTIVTFESHERLTIRHAPRRLMAWCDQCGADVLVVTPNEAAALTRIDARAIFRRVEVGEIHLIEDDGGDLMICSQSLRR